MTTLTRWKLACALFAGVALYATLGTRGAEGAGTPAALAAGPRGAAIPAYLRRPVRVSAEAAGLSRGDLIARALGARTLRDLRVLTDKLGLVGDDATVDALVPLVTDTRSGFPEEVLAIYGLIGTEHAIDRLIAATEDDRAGVRSAAITALGTSQGARAEAVLIGIASAATDPGRDAAIRALGRLGGERAIAVLIEIAHGDFAAASGAIDALGAISSPDAAAALRELIDAPDVRVAALALGQIQELDAPLIERLTEIVKGADPSLSGAALGLLARAGAASLPVLRAAALEGPAFTRSIAVAAIGEIEGPEATKILGEILETGDRAAASAAAEALAGNGGPEARELLIASALGDRAQITGALTQLQTMEGEDIDQALLTVIAQGTSADRRAALPRLLRAENPKALALAAEFARTGSRNERYEVMRMLSDAGSAKAIDALIDVASTTRGNARLNALDLLAYARPADPAVAQLLIDTMFTGRRDEATYAAGVLGRISTDDARSALTAALTGKDENVAAAAASALAQLGLSAQVKATLLAAAQTSPALKLQVMQQLAGVGAPEGLRLAAEMINGSDADAARTAVSSIAYMGTEESRRLVERAVDSKDPGVRGAAISALAASPDDKSTEMLVRLATHTDEDVRTYALSALGQVGSERAAQALMGAARSSSAADRSSAIQGLASIESPQASQQLASLIRDPDRSVANMAISYSYNAGPEVDRVLAQVLDDPSADEQLKVAAAYQLRSRGADMDDSLERKVAAIAGEGGAGYGGYH